MMMMHYGDDDDFEVGEGNLIQDWDGDTSVLKDVQFVEWRGAIRVYYS